MKRFRLFGLALLLSAAGLTAHAQVLIEGKVMTPGPSGKSEPVPGATILCPAGMHHAQTDSTGVFRLDMPHRPDSLQVRGLGFEPQMVPVPGSGVVTINLKVVGLAEVTIEDTRNTAHADHLSPINTVKVSSGEFRKAACCNLSESLESLGGVDAQQTDALTGRRQITMLSLSGSYVPLFVENVPAMRGIFAGQGFGQVPGPWIRSMAMTRGPGSVQNGFEGMAGSFNVELFGPEVVEEDPFDKVYLNAYVNQFSRSEANAILRDKLGKNVAGAMLLHGNYQPKMGAMDRNRDGFADQAWGQGASAQARLRWQNPNWMGQAGIWANFNGRTGGTLADHNASGHNHGEAGKYTLTTDSRYLQAWTKTGRSFEGRPYRSLGIINTATMAQQNARFGIRPYTGDQASYMGQLLYNTILGNTGRRLNLGATLQADQWNERVDSIRLKYREVIPGAYAELALDYGKVLVMPALSLQYGTLHGLFAIPRLHVRYRPREATTLKLAFGRGRRMPAALAENQNLLASGRAVGIGRDASPRYSGNQLGPELSWSGGLAWVEAMELGGLQAEWNTEAFYTWFERYLVADAERPDVTRFYTVKGMRALALQTTLDLKPMRRFDIRLGYRFYRPEVPYAGATLPALLVAGHRGMASLTYRTKSKWQFDLNGSLTGPRRYLYRQYSPAYTMLNAQISKTFRKRLDVYLGMENLLNFRQTDPILNPQNPFAQAFDAGRVWGPVMGRMGYLGVRWGI